MCKEDVMPFAVLHVMSFKGSSINVLLLQHNKCPCGAVCVMCTSKHNMSQAVIKQGVLILRAACKQPLHVASTSFVQEKHGCLGDAMGRLECTAGRKAGC